ncbi:MAG: hypothetical protein EBT20_16365, partial [Alphaproteobacteria bacterium]|nr:hypothetical protein [Alphaproteobacteria bacterium]
MISAPQPEAVDAGAVPPPAPRLHPNLATIYKEKIANLFQALNDQNTLIEANVAIRQLIDSTNFSDFPQ